MGLSRVLSAASQRSLAGVSLRCPHWEFTLQRTVYWLLFFPGFATPLTSGVFSGVTSWINDSNADLDLSVSVWKPKWKLLLRRKPVGEEEPPWTGLCSYLAPIPGSFEGGAPYRITVTAVSPGGLYPAPSVWSFREELGKLWGWKMEGPGTAADLDPLAFSAAPLVGPALWRLQDAPPGTPTIAWGEVPRHQLRGLLTHYTLCAQSGTRPSVCMNGELFCLPSPASSPHKTTFSLPHPLSSHGPIWFPLSPWENAWCHQFPSGQ